MNTRQFLAVVLLLATSAANGCIFRRVLCDDCCVPGDRGAFTCYQGNGCGERYYGDWYSHPPTPDPCGNCQGETRSIRRMPVEHEPMMAGGPECEHCGHGD